MDSTKIFISEQRGIITSDQYAILSTLNYDTFYSEHKEPIGSLTYVNDCFIEPNGKYSFTVDFATIQIILPLVEDITIKYADETCQIALGEIGIFTSEAGQLLEVESSNHNEVAFKHIVFAKEKEMEEGILKFPLPIFNSAVRNELIPIFVNQELPIQFYIGTYIGKESSLLNSSEVKFKNIFFTVLEGTFEINERLLFKGDSLYIDSLASIDIESLGDSNLLMCWTF